MKTVGSLVLKICSSLKAEISRAEILDVQVSETPQVTTSELVFFRFDLFQGNKNRASQYLPIRVHQGGVKYT